MPDAYPDAAEAHARYLLLMVKKQLLAIHKDQERELVIAGYDAFPLAEDRKGRITCDACKTAIADMFYSCADSHCGAEFCVACVRKLHLGELRVHRTETAEFSEAAAAGGGAAGATQDMPMPDAPAPAPAPLAPPRERFAEDTPEALHKLGLKELGVLRPASAPGPPGSAEAAGPVDLSRGYFNALWNLKTERNKDMAKMDLFLGRWFCPCSLHSQAGMPASQQRPQSVLLLHRRLPRVFIPQVLLDPRVKKINFLDALPKRTHSDDISNPPPEPPPCLWCARIAAATVPDEAGVRDLRTNPNLRRASHRGHPDDWLWTPAFADVDPAVIGPERYADACAHFQWHWRRRQFPVVRNVKSVRHLCRGFFFPAPNSCVCFALAPRLGAGLAASAAGACGGGNRGGGR